MRHEIPEINGHNGALRAVLEAACQEAECTLGELTVLSNAVDPYRLDTPSGHRDGQWAGEQVDRALTRRRPKIHLRGLHYTIVARGNVRKPNGETFVNDDDDWVWMSEGAAKAGRWLGYIDFEKIIDNRNAAPIIHRRSLVVPRKLVQIGVEVAIPGLADLEPVPVVEGFVGRQAYHFVFFGEKASLEGVLDPIARVKHADLYLPTGEISDTLLYRIAKDAVADGRRMVMFTLADADPAGYQMSVSIARKLQAFRDLKFPTLEFEVVPVALLVEQVRELGLPSTPLKESEKRADRWRAAFGVEQTEIDALATLDPDTLTEIVEDAFKPYYDGTLDERVEEAEAEWSAAAQAAIDEQVDPEILDGLRTEAAARLAELEAEINDINERLRLAGDRFTLPPIEVPEPEIDETAFRQALVHFGDDWMTATRALIARKRYGV
jgi:hypothetical protein